jgi:hypothetical protein
MTVRPATDYGKGYTIQKSMVSLRRPTQTIAAREKSRPSEHFCHAVPNAGDGSPDETLPEAAHLMWEADCGMVICDAASQLPRRLEIYFLKRTRNSDAG